MQIINVSPGDIYGYEDDPRAQDRDDLETGPQLSTLNNLTRR